MLYLFYTFDQQNTMSMKRLCSFSMALFFSVSMLFAQSGPHIYGIKSASLKIVTEMMEQKVEGDVWFDDYGAVQATVTKVAGTAINTIIREGKTYSVDYAAKQVRESPIQQESINYLNITDEVIEKYNLKVIGKDTVAGKECIKYSMVISQMGQSVKAIVSVWNGYPMKMVNTIGSMVITVAVKEFIEGPVDASHFEIPTFE